MTENRIPVDPESVCPRFDRASTSLIEEPEVCENCSQYDEGFCKGKDN